jgi:hypothetical protein
VCAGLFSAICAAKSCPGPAFKEKGEKLLLAAVSGLAEKSGAGCFSLNHVAGGVDQPKMNRTP